MADLLPRSAAPEPAGRPRGRRRLVTLAKTAVAVAILVVLFRRVPPGDVFAAMATARPLPLAAAVALALLGQLGVAYRLRILAKAQGLSFSTFRMLGINLSALFYGLFIPGGTVTAGAVRLYKMTRTEGRLAEALSAILRDRLDATLALAVVGLAFLALDRSPDAPLAWLGLGLGLAACLMVWLLLFHPGIARWVGARVGRFPLRFLRRPLVRLWEELEVTGRIRLAVQTKVFSISLAVHLMGIGAYLLLARSLALEIPAMAMGWIRSAVIFVTMIPVSLGGIGLREGAFLVFLAPYGIVEERVLALSFLVFAATVVLFGAAGGLIEARELVHGGRGSGGGQPLAATKEDPGGPPTKQEPGGPSAEENAAARAAPPAEGSA